MRDFLDRLDDGRLEVEFGPGSITNGVEAIGDIPVVLGNGYWQINFYRSQNPSVYVYATALAQSANALILRYR